MAVLNYVTQFETRIREMYGHELISNALFQSNSDINIRGAKEIKLPKMTVSGYKDHTRGALGFNTGNYSNDFEVKTLDHDMILNLLLIQWMWMKQIKLLRLQTFNVVLSQHKQFLN